MQEDKLCPYTPAITLMANAMLGSSVISGGEEVLDFLVKKLSDLVLLDIACTALDQEKM